MYATVAETRGLSSFCSSFTRHSLERSRRTAVTPPFRTTTRVRVARTTSEALRLQVQLSERIRRTHSDASQSLTPFDHTKRFNITQPPSPGWVFGDGMKRPVGLEEWAETEKKKVWDMGSTSRKEAYQLLTSAIVPRPIAFVSSLSSEGVPNLAPFSYFAMVSHDPPMLSVSFDLSNPRRPKDTRENILQTKEFTVNIISEPFIEAANSTAVESPADMNEWLLSGLTQAKSDLVKPAIVEESAVSLECELYSSQDISLETSGPPKATLVVGLIKRVHVREACLREDGLALDPAKLRPIARLGGLSYARVAEGFDLPRPSWKTAQGPYELIQKRQGHAKKAGGGDDSD